MTQHEGAHNLAVQGPPITITYRFHPNWSHLGTGTFRDRKQRIYRRLQRSPAGRWPGKQAFEWMFIIIIWIKQKRLRGDCNAKRSCKCTIIPAGRQHILPSVYNFHFLTTITKGLVCSVILNSQVLLLTINERTFSKRSQRQRLQVELMLLSLKPVINKWRCWWSSDLLKRVIDVLNNSSFAFPLTGRKYKPQSVVREFMISLHNNTRGSHFVTDSSRYWHST